ncbi:MAG: LPS assembly lipoprotein LptE [Verrucomicrobiota bacterium]
MFPRLSEKTPGSGRIAKPCPAPSRPDSLLRRTVAAGLFLAVFATITAGCAYSLGPTNQQVAGAQSITIEAFPNETLQPGLTDVVNNAVRRQVQRDGTFHLETRGTGDIIVTGKITRYGRLPLGSRRDNVLTPQDYDISITAKVKAMRGGQVVYEGEVIGRALVASTPNLNVSERENIPVAAENLARNLISSIANGSW